MKASFPVKKASLSLGGHLFLTAIVFGTVACNGVIGGVGGEPIGPGPGGNTPPGTGGAAGGGVTPPNAVDPGTKVLHRLNSTEYNNTIADVLGAKMQPANSSWLGGEIGGFDNIAAVLDVDEAQYKRYFDTAELVANDVFAAADSKAKVLTCVTEDAACVNGIIGATGKRLFRRPLSTDEIGTFNKVYAAGKMQGENHENSIKLVLRALLSSAEFVYRVEIDPTPNAPAKHPLNAFELASRLSYFLWSSAPDDTLLAAAENGSLAQDTAIKAQVDRMLNDPVKGARFVENFSGQWLGARKLPEHGANATLFPDWSAALAQSLTKEMYMYFSDFIKSDRPWTEFMKADMNFVDAPIAKLYGMPAGSAAMQRVENKTDNRFGFAGLGGFLSMSSLAERTSPTTRGRWILSNLLCAPTPDPPAGVPDLGEVGGLDPTKNVRLALEEHRKNATCAACHKSLDGYGLALENFDAVGKYRTTYPDGSTIDTSADVDGVKFNGLQGLADNVSSDPRFSECVGEFLFKYGLGRMVTDTDRPYLKAVNEEWVKGPQSVRRLVQGLVLAETFRSRTGAAAK